MAQFALHLDQPAIALSRRTEGGDREPLGHAPLDAPDFDARLRALQASAAAIARGPVETDLVIPESQILYLDLPLSAHAPGGRRGAVARALAARMPEEAGTLAFDWQGEGPTPRVALVSRDTLREAEAFAAAYGFHPVRFVADPGPDAGFAGIPDFGPTAAAPASPFDPAAHRADERHADPASDAPARRPARRRTRAAMAAIPSPAGGRATRARPPSRPPAERARRRPGPLALAGGAAAIAIAAFAAWTLRPGSDEVELSAVAPEAELAIDAAPEASPPPEPRPFAAEPVVVPVPPAGSPPPQAADPAVEPEASPAAPEPEGRRAAAPDPERSEADRALAAYAATGIWQTPPAPTPAPEADELALPETAVDAPTLEMAALPAPAAPTSLTAAARPALLAPTPPAAGSELSRDGRVPAAPDGEATSDGTTALAAAPPPPRPRPSQTVSPPEALAQDPALAGLRPRARPGDGPGATAVAADGARAPASTAAASTSPSASAIDAAVAAAAEGAATDAGEEAEDTVAPRPERVAVPEDAFRAAVEPVSPPGSGVAFGEDLAAEVPVPGLVSEMAFAAPALEGELASASLFRSPDALSMASRGRLGAVGVTEDGFAVSAARPTQPDPRSWRRSPRRCERLRRPRSPRRCSAARSRRRRRPFRRPPRSPAGRRWTTPCRSAR